VGYSIQILAFHGKKKDGVFSGDTCKFRQNETIRDDKHLGNVVVAYQIIMGECA
jgi:hypothetical protein